MKSKAPQFLLLLVIVASCQLKNPPIVAEQTYQYDHQIFDENILAPLATFFAFESSNI